MIATGLRSSAEATRKVHVHSEHIQGVKSEWMRTGDDARRSPTVSMIEQPANMVLPAHFHRNNQFQVFVDGDGKIGGRGLGPVTVHYAGAYTAYGPLTAGSEGLKYFTIRPVYETGAIMVSDSKEVGWPVGPRRYAISQRYALLGQEQLDRLEEIETTHLIARGEDGLLSLGFGVPRGTNVPGIEMGAGDGVFLLILAGSMTLQGQTLERWESVYISPDEPMPELIAGDDGLQIAAMVPPKRDSAYPIA